MKEKSESVGSQVALELLRIGAMAISSGEPFVWSSGMLSPFYCDNRLTLSYPKIRRMLMDAFIKESEKYEFDYVAGVATAGIAHAAFVAHKLSLPLIYVRPEAKGHGHENQIEGHLPENAKVLMIEDLIATGLSAIQAAEAVQKTTGSMPVAILAIFTYNLSGVAEVFESKGSPLKTLSNFDILLQVAVQNGYIDTEMYDSLLGWRSDYQAWTIQKSNK